MMFSLAACTAPLKTEVPTRQSDLPDILPAMQSFPARKFSTAVARANSDITRDFLELTFEMESGKLIQRMSRFEGPITVAFAQEAPDQFQADLAALLVRFRTEAGLNITQGATGQPANIVVETLPRKELQAAVPAAACFVVPRVSSWEEFKRNRRTGQLDWSTLTSRTRTTVFIPDDVSAQEARDCLHEEIAQSLGPLNDLYRLSDSIFNDDNINTVLTGFDMLILRTYYSPELKSGLTRAEASKIVPGVLARINPAGRNITPDGLRKTPRVWIDTIESAIGPRTSQPRRLTLARKAMIIARQEGWLDNRMGFNLFVLGRLSLGVDPETSAASFSRAFTLYAGLYGIDDIHTANVAVQLAAFALSTGNSKASINLINKSLPAVMRAQNATLLSTLLMIKAEALDFDGKNNAAALVRLDSIGWARYGFGSDEEIRARLGEIANLRPRAPKPEV